MTAFQDLPLADQERAWDGDAADKRVREWADAQDEPNDKYREAHVWYDKENKENFGAYKLLIADIVDGRLTAVPRGVMAAAAVMQGSRGGIDLPAGSSAGANLTLNVAGIVPTCRSTTPGVPARTPRPVTVLSMSLVATTRSDS